MGKIVMVLCAGALLWTAGAGLSPVWGQEDWKQAFDAVCSKTQDSMSRSRGELEGYITECDRLQPRIEDLQGAQRKVYLKRLKMCRNLFVFVLESKDREKP